MPNRAIDRTFASELRSPASADHRGRVVDNGSGISAALLPKIFDPFFTT
jgi:signal transduction histidine kinase